MTERHIQFETEPLANVTIREATIEDVVALRSMQQASWRATYPNEAEGVSKDWVYARTAEWLAPDRIAESTKRLERVLADPNAFYRVAELNGEVVGFVHASTSLDKSKYLEAIYTSPATFGRGIGTQLMDPVIEWAGESDFILEVVAYNARALKFYEKYGFSKIKGSDHLYADTMPTIFMKRTGVQP